MAYRFRPLVWLASALALAACHAPASTQRAANVTALVDVDVLPIATDTLLEHQTILVADGVITALGPRDRVAVPSGAVMIPAAGKFVMPGMADMHVHLPDTRAEIQRVLDLSLAHGITVIRGMQGAPAQLAARDDFRREHAPVPDLYLAGPPITTALTPDEARATARATKAAGYDFIKVIGGIDGAAYDALVATAHELAIPVCGHVPAEIGIEAALAAHQSSIEHGMGYGAAARSSPAALDALAARTRAAGIFNCPTLRYFATGNAADVAELQQRDGMALVDPATLAEWSQEQATATHDADAMQVPRQIVAALAHAGAPLLVGSDSPGTFSVPGFAYVEELRELARAGLTPYAILRAATLDAARYLGKDRVFGTVAVGMRADLVVLDADPRLSLDNLAHPAGVLLRGQWLARDVLEARLRPAASR